ECLSLPPSAGEIAKWPISNAPRQRRLKLAHRWGLPSHPSHHDGVWGWVAETGLERSVHSQVPLRGNENVQTPERRPMSARPHLTDDGLGQSQSATTGISSQPPSPEAE